MLSQHLAVRPDEDDMKWIYAIQHGKRGIVFIASDPAKVNENDVIVHKTVTRENFGFKALFGKISLEHIVCFDKRPVARMSG